MANENEDIKEEEVEEVEEIVESVDEATGEDTTDWKALALKNQGIAKRNKTRALKALEKAKSANPPKEAKDPVEKKETLDKLDRAILRVEKITEPGEVKLVEDYMKETGKDLETVLGSKYFQAELKEMRELAASDAAIPAGNKRAGNASASSVEYWLNIGKLPPVEQVDLRRQVVNAKIKAEKGKSHFSGESVV
jgi:hypothetical protein